MSTPEDCMNILDDWIDNKKSEYEEKHFRGPRNDENVLDTYAKDLEDLFFKTMDAINKYLDKNDNTDLRNLEWNEEMLKCVRYVFNRNEILDRLRVRLCDFPHEKNRHLIETFKKEDN